MKLKVTSDLIAALTGQSRAAHPKECCGILLGRADRIDAIRPTRNVHSSPETHFEIEPQSLVDAHRNARHGGPKVVGYYHSHPVGSAEPSDTDAAMAAGDGSIWAIIAGGQLAFWRDGDEGFEALPYRIVDR